MYDSQKSVKIGTVEMKVGELRKAYQERNDHLREMGYFNIRDMSEFFHLLFERDGKMNLQELGFEHYYDKHYNGIVLTMDKNSRVKQYVLTRELSNLDKIEGANFAICSPVTYVGRRRTLKSARLCYGFAFDLDSERGVLNRQLDVLHSLAGKYQLLPPPSFIVSSGSGIHIYLLFKKPIQMFPENVKLLERLKHCLTSRIWTKLTSTLEKPQFQGLDQGYRIPFTETKFGSLVLGFRKEEIPYYTVTELNSYMRKVEKQMIADKPLTDEELAILESDAFVPSKVTLAMAKERYPDWYEKRIVRGDKSRQYWNVNENVYNWWLNICRNSPEVSVGHRYFCMMCLAVYAAKCNIPYERLRNDAISLIPRMGELTDDPENPFTEEDVDDALKAYQESYKTFPRKTIQLISGIFIPENKRNYRTQKKHLAIARQTQALDWEDKEGHWYDNNGRKPKELEVAMWRIDHPDETNKSLCARDLGLTRPTVRKWWDSPLMEQKRQEMEEDRRYQEYCKEMFELETSDAVVNQWLEDLENPDSPYNQRKDPE